MTVRQAIDWFLDLQLGTIAAAVGVLILIAVALLWIESALRKAASRRYK
jgi:hypothetical protein